MVPGYDFFSLHLLTVFLAEKTEMAFHCRGTLKVSFDLQLHAGDGCLQSVALTLKGLHRVL